MTTAKRLNLETFLNELPATLIPLSNADRIISLMDQVLELQGNPRMIESIAIHFEAIMPGWSGECFVNDVYYLSYAQKSKVENYAIA